MSGSSRFYRRDGTPYEGEFACLEWALDHENMEQRVVEQTTLPNGLWVSTVWLGLDHSFWDGPPLIFESMVFERWTAEGNADTGTISDQERYSTEEEARAGHKRMCEKWSNLIDALEQEHDHEHEND